METIECMPKSALNLYIMLYCRKRKILNGKSQTILREATKSWFRLSESEKEIFTSKYNKIQAEYKQKLADSLKNVTPYLKKKYHRRHSHNEINSNRNNFEIVLHDTKLNNIEEVPNESVTSNENAAVDQQIEINTNNHESLNQTLMMGHQPEPVPPMLKSGKELFQILYENEKSKTWETLSKSEKRRYQYAVLTIKKKYLKSYRSHLESLTPIELYNHYINKKEGG